MRKIATLLTSIVILILSLLFFSASSIEQIFGSSTHFDRDELEHKKFEAGDSVTIAAISFVNEPQEKLNFRKAWRTPIKVPVFLLDTLESEFTIVEGGDTKDMNFLTLKSQQGYYLELRPIGSIAENNPPRTIRALDLDHYLKEEPIDYHPFASLLAAEMSKKSGILDSQPQLVYVPNQGQLANGNPIIGNQLCLLAYKADTGMNWTDHENVLSLKSSQEVYSLKNQLKERFLIDKEAFIRSRLFDLLIGDWEASSREWGWIIEEDGRHLKATPISTGHYFSFYNSEKLFARLNAEQDQVSELFSIQSELDLLSGFVDPIDVQVLEGLSEDQYITEARRLQLRLTDENLATLIAANSDYQADMHYSGIVQTMKDRRDNLIDFAKEFKQIIDIRNQLYVREDLDESEGFSLASD